MASTTLMADRGSYSLTVQRRAFHVSLIVSVIAHLAIMGALHPLHPTRAARVAHDSLEWIDVEMTPVRPARPEPRPTSVTPATINDAPVDRAAEASRRITPHTRATSDPAPVNVTAPERTPSLPGAGLLAMRSRSPDRASPGSSRDRDVDLADSAPDPAISPESVARALARLVGPPPPPRRRSILDPPLPGKPLEPRSELIPDGNGTFRADDEVFTARISRDGRVSIEDKPNFQAHGPRAADIGRHLEAWADDPYGIATRETFGAVKLASGSFDLTDWAMRAAGQDPYYHRKARFLDRTRDERAMLAAGERSSSLRNAIVDLPAYLDEVWAQTAWPAARRRRVLFQLWDECAERGADEVVESGRLARMTIIGFIRRTLPRTSQDAYTDAELRALNDRRQSSAVFAPYRD